MSLPNENPNYRQSGYVQIGLMKLIFLRTTLMMYADMFTEVIITLVIPSQTGYTSFFPLLSSLSPVFPSFASFMPPFPASPRFLASRYVPE